MIPKPLASIDTTDLEALVAAPRLEDRQIDYKLDLTGSSDDDKREFLGSFANYILQPEPEIVEVCYRDTADGNRRSVLLLNTEDNVTTCGVRKGNDVRANDDWAALKRPDRNNVNARQSRIVCKKLSAGRLPLPGLKPLLSPETDGVTPRAGAARRLSR